MKRCRECNRVYSDETLNFCLEDGAWLVDDANPDPPTAIIPNVEPATAPTQQQVTITQPTEILSSPTGEAHNFRRSKRGVVIAAALAVVVLGSVGALMYRSRGSETKTPSVSLQSAKISRLTSSGKVAGAVISPDGKYVAHVVDDGGQQSIWIRQTATSSNIQLVPPAEVGYTGLVFSPDGNYVYYSVYEKDATGALYQVAVLGGSPRKIVTGISGAIAFSADGKRIAFYRGRGQSDNLMIANADGTGERIVATRSGDEQFTRGVFSTLSWSPDGKTIAGPFLNFPENFMTVVAVSVETGEVKQFTNQRWFDVKQVAWLSGGTAMLVTAQQSANAEYSIWSVAYPSGEVQKVTNDLNSYRSVSVTADNSTLATVQAERNSSLWVTPANDSAHAIQVTHDRSVYSRASWTPDGRLIYNSDAAGSFDLFLSDADGNNAKQLTTNAGWNGDASVSPDGRTIVFMSDRTGPPHIWRMDIDGANQKQLSTGAFNVRPRLSPDGQWIVYASSANQGWYIWKMPADGGPAIQLTDQLSDYPVFSPDGTQIACFYWETSNAQTKIAILPLDGGQPIKLFAPTLPAGREANLQWTADGRSLVYSVTKNGVSNLWAQPVDGGEPKQITNFNSERIVWFEFSRDGKKLVAARGVRPSDVVLIKDFR